MAGSTVFDLSRGLCTLLAALAALALFTPPAAAQETGVVTGRAVQAETGDPLSGAEVRVVGTSIATLTGNDGRFLLLRVPVGSRTVELRYLGRETATEQVTVQADQTTSLDFAVDVSPVALEGIDVLGFRAMTQARALTEQQNAPNIKNVVASDQIGRFPDASAPEALRRIPGIAVETDQGEGRYVQIRGGRTEFTKVTMNGASVPSPEGEDRQVALDAVPVDILESIEVTKAITPDMPADAIGGAVNLVTKKAPADRRLTLELGGGYAPIREEPSSKVSASYGERFAEGRLGLIVSGSFSDRDFGSDDIEPEYDIGDPGLGDDELVEFQTRHYSLERQRTGATAALDYRFSETSDVQLSGSYTEHEDTEERRVLNHVIEDDELVWEHKNREENLRIAAVTASGDHVLGSSGVQLLWNGSFSHSEEDTPFDNEVFFLQEDVSFAPDMSDPDRIRPNPRGGALGGPFEFDEVEFGGSVTTNTDFIGGLDLGVPYSLGGQASGILKFGGSFKTKEKDQDVDEFAGELAGGGPLFLSSFGQPFDYDADDFNPGRYPLPSPSTTGDQVLGFPDAFDLEREKDREADSEDYVLNERVYGAYVMTELNVTPNLLFLPGVRWERTDFDADAFEFDAETETLSPTTAEKDYDNVFPMAHLRYRLSDETNVRAAYTSAISRPNFFNLVPFRIRDEEDLELGNPDLDPTLSDNVDVMIEHYNQRIGIISAGFFAKWLDDPIFIFTRENELGGDTEQAGNGESGWIRGVELAIQQQLTFLPGALSGLGIYANYTWTDSEGELPGGRTAQLLGQAEHAYNLALSYERAGFSGQLSLNFVDSYIDEYGEVALEDEYVGDREQLDFSASYQATSYGTVFLELVNLTNSPFRLFQGVEERPRQIEFYEPWGQLGVRLTTR